MSFYIVSTPIGNLKDLTYRAAQTLQNCDLIICEKKSKALKLVSHLGIKGVKLIPYHDSKVERILPIVIEHINNSKNISLICDAGTPLISDPGSLLIKRLINEGIEPVPIPGPSSSISALILSGFNTSKFIFYGFLPKSSDKIKKEIDKIISHNHPVIFYTSKTDLKKIFELYKDTYEKILFSLSKELTKKYDKTIRGTLNNDNSKILNSFYNKGEFVLILHKAENSSSFSELEIKKRVKNLKAKLDSKKSVAEIIQNEFKIKKNLSYKLTLKFW